MEQQATEAIRMAEELAIAREEFELSAIHTQAILDAMVEGLVTIDEFGRIQTMNNAIKDIFGYALEDIKNTEILNLFKTTRFSSTEDLLGYIKAKENKEYRAKETAIRKDKSEFPIELSIREIHLGSKREFTVLFRDITDREEAEKLIHRMALQDSLTGLANRNLLKKRLDENLKTARRNKSSLAVMFLDLDNFKPVNDLYGHGVGDKLLQIVSERLLAAARETDTVARLGGDEFAIVLTNIDDVNAISTIAERILGSIQEPVIIDDKTLQIGTSIGVSFYPDDSLNPDELIRMADVALYKAKEAGRRTYRLYNAKMDSSAKQEKLIITELAQAIDNNDLHLYYQPQVDSKSLEIVGVEALIRWLHPQRGMVPPKSFISSAESSGLIHPIGQWVLDTACIQTKKWQDQGLPKFKICINISARQFQASEFLDTVKSAIKKSSLSPKYIELEITEGMVIDDTETMITKLQDLAALGISLSIDDFGTGYSSLAYLKRFPVDQLKIDQSFIHDILDNHDDAAITDAVIQLGHSIGMTVVGEGVETTAQVKLLREKGCDILQGYYFSRPIPQDDFPEWVINYTPEIL
jgi:diguanylate cyclase (GGDEF)-like protein/PAS domain S-box-containing protein